MKTRAFQMFVKIMCLILQTCMYFVINLRLTWINFDPIMDG